MSIALCIVAVLLFILSLPAVIELSLFLFANLCLRRGPAPGPRDRGRTRAAQAKIAILVPAHDEERCIKRCVASILASEAGPYQREAIVVADNCHDATAELARKAGARVIERFDEARRGKGAALDYALSLLMGEDFEAFAVVDADSVVSEGFVLALGEAFAGGMEAVQCVDLPLNVEASPRIRLMNLSLLSMNVFRPQGRELLGCSVGIMGNGFGLSKKLLREVPYSANSIAEDLEYHLRLIEKGHRVRFIAGARVLADFPVSKEGAKTQRARWEGGRFLLQRSFGPRLLSEALRGRLSMLEPLLELMSMPLSYEVLFLLLLIMIPGQPFLPYGIAALAIIAGQMVASVALYGRPRDFLAFFEIPGYLLWKIVSLPGILLASRRGTEWVRTKRD